MELHVIKGVTERSERIIKSIPFPVEHSLEFDKQRERYNLILQINKYNLVFVGLENNEIRCELFLDGQRYDNGDEAKETFKKAGIVEYAKELVENKMRKYDLAQNILFLKNLEEVRATH